MGDKSARHTHTLQTHPPKIIHKTLSTPIHHVSFLTLLQLQVPGSTSNLGPCFDAVGLAVDVLLCVRVYWKPVIDSIDGGDVGNNYEGEGKNHRDSDLAPDKVAVPLRFTGEGIWSF